MGYLQPLLLLDILWSSGGIFFQDKTEVLGAPLDLGAGGQQKHRRLTNTQIAGTVQTHQSVQFYFYGGRWGNTGTKLQGSRFPARPAPIQIWDNARSNPTPHKYPGSFWTVQMDSDLCHLPINQPTHPQFFPYVVSCLIQVLFAP